MADIDTTPSADTSGSTNSAPENTASPAATSHEGGPTDLGSSAATTTPAGADQGSSGTQSTDPRQMLKDGASKYGAQATDRIRTLADTGKEKAGGALDQFSTMLTDAAGQVDEKLGAQYGDYARQAAGLVSDFSDSIKTKNVDDLLEDARGYVRQSPAVAIGVAAALGFVIARLAQAGIETGAAATAPDPE